MKISLSAIALVVLIGVSQSNAATITSFAAVPTPGQWSSSTTAGGTVGIVDISGAGGNLASAQPLPPGAVRFTTGLSNADAASIALTGNFGTASSVINGALGISYSYYNGTAPGGNTFAAPALRLSFFNPAAAGDNFVTLIYEPYWNQASPGTAQQPPQDLWTTVSVSSTSGLFWQNGGFGQANSFGGPPFNTIAGWDALFNSPDFDNAQLVGISFGVGTFNQGQDDYLDNVTISINGVTTNYNFDLAAAAEVPEPASLAVWSLLAAGGAVMGWRRKRK